MKFERIHRWCPAADAGLCDAVLDNRDELACGVNSGKLELYKLDDGAAWLVTCVDVDTRELIVCCVQGQGLENIAPILYRIAQNNGLSAVRFFTTRPALARLLRPFPVRLLGYVYRCEVAPRVSQ